MKKWMVILIGVIIILLILIAVFYNPDVSHDVSNYSQIETQMRKLWY